MVGFLRARADFAGWIALRGLVVEERSWGRDAGTVEAFLARAGG